MEPRPVSADELLHILLLEDSDIDSDLIATHLEAGPFRFALRRADTREKFEAALAEPIDVILADYALPDFDGLSALAIAAERLPLVPFLFVSGVVGEEFATRALQRGATDYVTKRNLRRLPGAVSRAVGEARERNRRRAIEAALAETEDRFRLMADHAPAFIWATDEQGRLTFVNHRFESEFGIAAADLLGGGLDRVFHPDDYADRLAAFQAAVRAREPFKTEMRARSRDGDTRWLRAEATPRFDAVGNFVGYVGCDVDITEARLAADILEQRVRERTDRLQKAEEALRQAQKMEAIGQLTGGIAHDFNNILAAIIGSLSVVKRRIASNRLNDLDRFIDGAIASGNRAAGLTQRLLAFSRRQSLDVRSTDINDAIRRVEDLLRHSLGENVALEVGLDADLFPALTDANQFENAILNLVINARDAMPDGGRVSITTGRAAISAAEAEPHGITAGDYVRIVVADTGEGMDPEVLGKAFDPFFTTKPIGQGTGLGLSTIYGFVKQTGGHVAIDSAAGEGTSVTLLLRRSDEDLDRAAPLPPAEAMRAREGELVLVVEDEPSVRMLILDVLDELGYAAREAGDARAALAQIDGSDRFDLLITDVGLPGMSGRELAETVRHRHPDLPVLFVTGYAEGAHQRSDFLGPHMQMMSKPFEMDALAARIRSMLAGGS